MLRSLNAQRYVPGFDGLRGAAILAVVGYHYVAGWPAPPIVHGMQHVFWSGWRGVDVFFVLSGFLIGLVLEDSQQKADLLKTFFWRRAWRILPLYWLCFLGLVVVPSLRRDLSDGTALATGATPIWAFPLFARKSFLSGRRRLETGP